MRDTDLDIRIMDAAEQILKVNHGTLSVGRLVARIMDDCCEHLAPDVAQERVSAVLASAVTKKQLIRKSESYTLPPPPTPAVAFTPHAAREAQQEAARRAQRQAAAAKRTTRTATAPAGAKQPFAIPTAPATVKVPPKPAPPEPPAPAPFIDMHASMDFTIEPIARASQPSLFDPTHPALTPAAEATARPRARRRAEITPPDPRPLRQASLLPTTKEHDSA